MELCFVLMRLLHSRPHTYYFHIHNSKNPANIHSWLKNPAQIHTNSPQIHTAFCVQTSVPVTHTHNNNNNISVWSQSTLNVHRYVSRLVHVGLEWLLLVLLCTFRELSNALCQCVVRYSGENIQYSGTWEWNFGWIQQSILKWTELCVYVSDFYGCCRIVWYTSYTTRRYIAMEYCGSGWREPNETTLVSSFCEVSQLLTQLDRTSVVDVSRMWLLLHCIMHTTRHTTMCYNGNG